jgi:hypothetical protein
MNKTNGSKRVVQCGVMNASTRSIGLAAKQGAEDGAEWAAENPGEIEAALAPGQLEADESLLSAMGSDFVCKAWKLKSATGPIWSACLDAYNAAWRKAVEASLVAEPTS